MGLRESSAKWKIVVGHHAIKSASIHGNTKELESLLLPILEVHFLLNYSYFKRCFDYFKCNL